MLCYKQNGYNVILDNTTLRAHLADRARTPRPQAVRTAATAPGPRARPGSPRRVGSHVMYYVL